jgi:C1A family cysteine protease
MPKLIPFAKFLLRRNHFKLKNKIGFPMKFGLANLPTEIDLRERFGPVYDQQDIGSCTANAIVGAYRLMSKKRFEGSRLFLYCQERLMEQHGSKEIPLSDVGAFPREGFNYIATTGLCSELSYPYDTKKVNEFPPDHLLEEAKKHRLSGIFDIDTNSGEQTIQQIEHSLSQGIPLCIGVAIYESFMTEEVKKSGIVPVPKPQRYDQEDDPKDKVLGGHEMIIVGYLAREKMFIVANSWGPQWGLSGFCLVPYDFILNPHLCQECTGFQTTIETDEDTKDAKDTMKAMKDQKMTVDQCLSELFTKLIKAGRDPAKLILSAHEFIANVQSMNL